MFACRFTLKGGGGGGVMKCMQTTDLSCRYIIISVAGLKDKKNLFIAWNMVGQEEEVVVVPELKDIKTVA